MSVAPPSFSSLFHSARSMKRQKSEPTDGEDDSLSDCSMEEAVALNNFNAILNAQFDKEDFSFGDEEEEEAAHQAAAAAAAAASNTASAAPMNEDQCNSDLDGYDTDLPDFDSIMGTDLEDDEEEVEPAVGAGGAPAVPTAGRPPAAAHANPSAAPPSQDHHPAAASRRLPHTFQSVHFHGWEVGARYEMVRVLGHGSYGQVAEAYDRVLNRRVAIKRIPNVFDNETDARRIYREMYILRQTRHPGVITLLDVIPPKDFASFRDLYLVFEFVDTDLYKLILSPQQLSNDHIQTLLYQMLLALNHVHSANVIHRDIKPANILLNEDCSLKICDFGLSRVVTPEVADEDVVMTGAMPAPKPMTRQMSDEARNEEIARAKSRMGAPRLTRQLTKHVVTRWYRAPELILLQDYSQAVDMWSLACVFAELLTMQAENLQDYKQRQPLFPGRSCYPLSVDVSNNAHADRMDQLRVIFDVIGTPRAENLRGLGQAQRYVEQLPKRNPRPWSSLFPGSDPQALDLLSRMLHFNPEKRITVAQALEHPYLAKVRDTAYETTVRVPIPDPDQESSTGGLSNRDALRQKIYQEAMYYQRRTVQPPTWCSAER